MKEATKITLARETGLFVTDSRMVGNVAHTYYAGFTHLVYQVSSDVPTILGCAVVEKRTFDYGARFFQKKERTLYRLKTDYVTLRGYAKPQELLAEAVVNAGLEKGLMFSIASIERMFSGPQQRLDTALRDFTDNVNAYVRGTGLRAVA